MRALQCLALSISALGMSCVAESHSVEVLNKTDVILEDVHVTIEKDRNGLGAIGPDVSGVVIFGGGWPKEVTVEWIEGKAERKTRVALGNVHPEFRGTVILRVHPEGKVDVVLEVPLSEPLSPEAK